MPQMFCLWYTLEYETDAEYFNMGSSPSPESQYAMSLRLSNRGISGYDADSYSL